MGFWKWFTNPRCRYVLTAHECHDDRVIPRSYHPDLGKPDAPAKKPHEEDSYLRDNPEEEKKKKEITEKEITK